MKFDHLHAATEDFEHLSQFRDKQDFNNNVEQWLADHKDEFSRGELIAFKRLVRYACKTPGIATASVNKILKAINDMANGYGVSESTFHRMKRKAIGLGTLKVETKERPNGSQSSNVWQFNRYHVAEIDAVCNTIDTPKESPAQGEITAEVMADKGEEVYTENERLTPLETSTNFKTSNTSTTRRAPALNYTFVYDEQLNKFIDVAGQFYHDYPTVKELVKATKQASRKYNHYVEFVDVDIESMAIESFKRTVDVEKDKRSSRKPIRNVIGLYVKILREIIMAEFADVYWSAATTAEKVTRDTSFYYDWLNTDEGQEAIA